jgi:Flp pilus assembly protein TadB
MADEEPVGEIDATLAALVLQQLARIESQIESERLNSAESRRQMHVKQDDLEKRMWNVDYRMENLEKTVSATSPFLTEYQTYRQRVIGAGMVGRGLWFLGGILLSAAASAAAVYAWLASHLQIPK